jgi:hypothetical protein
MHVLLRAGDMLSDLVACARDGVPPDAGRMGSSLPSSTPWPMAAPGDDDAPFEFVPTVLSVEPIGVSETTTRVAHDTETMARWNRCIHWKSALHRRVSFTEPATNLWRCCARWNSSANAHRGCDDAAVAPLAEFDPAQPRLRWTLTLVSTGSSRGNRGGFRVRGRCGAFRSTRSTAGEASMWTAFRSHRSGTRPRA